MARVQNILCTLNVSQSFFHQGTILTIFDVLGHLGYRIYLSQSFFHQGTILTWRNGWRESQSFFHVAILFSSRNNSDLSILKVRCNGQSVKRRNPFFIKEQFWQEVINKREGGRDGSESRNPFFIKEQFWRGRDGSEKSDKAVKSRNPFFIKEQFWLGNWGEKLPSMVSSQSFFHQGTILTPTKRRERWQ